MAALIGAALIGGGFAYAGAKKTGEANAEQAALHREWTKEMRASAYQDTMEDMKKAGLNPLLAYKQGPSPFGTGASAQSPNMGAAAAQGAQAAVATAKAAGSIPKDVAQNLLYVQQLENAVKDGKLLDQRWDQGLATAKESQIYANYLGTRPGVETALSNYIGANSTSGKTLGRVFRFSEKLGGGIGDVLDEIRSHDWNQGRNAPNSGIQAGSMDRAQKIQQLIDRIGKGPRRDPVKGRGGRGARRRNN